MHDFDRETRLVAHERGAWTGRVHPAWNIGANPNGGYLLSLAVAALREAAPEHVDPLSVTVHYLRPGLADQACRIDTQVLRTGRTLTTARATLVQDGGARLAVSRPGRPGRGRWRKRVVRGRSGASAGCASGAGGA